MLCINLTACINSQTEARQGSTIQKLDLAFVEDFIFTDISTDEVTLLAHGHLPDACTQIEKSIIERTEEAIIISIFSLQTRNTNCGTNPIEFNEEIIIDLGDSTDISKTVIVNGISAPLDRPLDENSGEVSLSTPIPSPEKEAGTTHEEKDIDQSNSDIIPVDISPTPAPTDPSQQSEDTANVTEQSIEPTDSSRTLTADNPSRDNTQSTNEPSDVDLQASQCEDKASFYADLTVPDNTLFKPGDEFEKVWRVRNEGTCTWNTDYSLVFAGGEIMNAALSYPLSMVTPGEITDISINLQAPARWGQYTGNWQFQNDRGERFGVGSGGFDYIWVQIFIDSPNSVPTPNSASGSPSDQPAQQPVLVTGGCDSQRDDNFEMQVLTLINNARNSHGLNSLNPQSQLSNAAYHHSTDMSCNDFIGHSGSDSSSWYDRVSAQGYANYNSARENIYVGNPQFGGTPEGAVEWWMNSQVHRDNIMNPDIAEIGIGYSYNSSSTYGGYYTVVFARP